MKASNSTNNNKNALYAYAIAAVALGIAWKTHGTITTTLQGRPRDTDAKPFTNLTSFYEFYLQEHRDPTCRVLHFIGTTCASVGMLKAGIVPHLLLGISCGLLLCEFLAPLPNGLVEFASVFIITAISCQVQSKQRFPWMVLVMGYLPAWIGHYFFEHNRPATFIYPTYSLLSDYRMWSQMLQGRLPWNEKL